MESNRVFFVAQLLFILGGWGGRVFYIVCRSLSGASVAVCKEVGLLAKYLIGLLYLPKIWVVYREQIPEHLGH